MKRVEVTWVDACMNGPGWKSVECARRMKPERCRSVGYLVRQTKKHLTLAQSCGETCDVANLVCIPMAWVTSIRRLAR